MQVAELIKQYDASHSGTLDRFEFEHMVLILPTDALSFQLTSYLANRHTILPTDSLTFQLTSYLAN